MGNIRFFNMTIGIGQTIGVGQCWSPSDTKDSLGISSAAFNDSNNGPGSEYIPISGGNIVFVGGVR